ncbi:hypothetical protein ABG067_005189 [Albugo candida]
MEKFDQEEPKAYVKYYIAFLRPALFKETIKSETSCRGMRPTDYIHCLLGIVKEHAMSFQRYGGPILQVGMIDKSLFLREVGR